MFLQLLQRNSDFYPQDVAVVYGSERLCHAELLDKVERLAGGLAELGIRRGDRVALLLENSPEFLVSFYAVAAQGGVNVPLNVEFKASEIAYCMANAEARFMITDSQRAGLALSIASGMAYPVRIIVRGVHPDNTHSLSELCASDRPASFAAASLDSDIVYMYSSGTTGQAKCVPRTVVEYWWEMQSVMDCLKLTRDDTIFCSIPLFHNFGAVQCMLAAAGSAAKLVLLESTAPIALSRGHALKLIERERATILPSVPFVFDHLASGSVTADLSSVRVCYSAAAALLRETADAFFDKFAVPIRQHYGCTEAGAISIDLDPEPNPASKSVGPPMPGVRIKILDETGRELPVEETGNVAVASRAMTRGYLGMEELNREAFRDGCFHTGDLGHLDAEGRLFLTGRKKHVIDVVGHKLSPMEVEEVLADHPMVKEAIVVGVPNEHGDDQVVQAYVVLRGPCTEPALLAYCGERLANYKVPQAIRFISQVPRNALGKVVRTQQAIDGVLEEAAPRGLRSGVS